MRESFLCKPILSVFSCIPPINNHVSSKCLQLGNFQLHNLVSKIHKMDFCWYLTLGYRRLILLMTWSRSRLGTNSHASARRTDWTNDFADEIPTDSQTSALQLNTCGLGHLALGPFLHSEKDPRPGDHGCKWLAYEALVRRVDIDHFSSICSWAVHFPILWLLHEV